MLTTYMLAFTLASLSAIAVDDLKIGRFVNASMTHTKIIQNKISRNIRYLRLVKQRKRNKLKRL